MDDNDRMLERLGARVRTLREARGLTQDQLAEMIGVDTQTVQRMERAKISPALSRVLAVASALDVAIADLFSEEGAPIEQSVQLTPDELALLTCFRDTSEARRGLALRVLREIERG